jgi:hypothetical protein
MQAIPAMLNPKFHELLRFNAKVKATAPALLAERAGLDSAIEKTQPQIDKISSHRNKLNDLTGKEWIPETATVGRQRGIGASHPHTQYKKVGNYMDDSLGHRSLLRSGRLESGSPGVLRISWRVKYLNVN